MNFKILSPGFLFVLLLVFSGCVAKKAPQTAATLQVESSFSGIASWYGGKFHGRKTASGERFNMHALTAAHRSLPFGTQLEILNPSNEKTVLVTVNDRGPFIRGVVLDLSLGAAQALDMVHNGHAKIIAKVLKNTDLQKQ